ncbi:hypothetical protein GQ44DRAFT_701667 [Phaeosphaeriaceae sp. PMI808]|nr:hypothetical protein GQ44DRAFT_701667 [Phaeosphaeriaceae sp. PMI808]
MSSSSIRVCAKLTYVPNVSPGIGPIGGRVVKVSYPRAISTPSTTLFQSAWWRLLSTTMTL